MSHVVIGNVSHVVRGSETNISTTSGGFGGTQVRGSSTQIVSFRLDGKPVEFKTSGTLPSLSDGDRVVAAGGLKGGTLHALAVRNASTGSVHYNAWMWPLIAGILLVLIGIPFMILLIGFLIVPLGVWVIFRALAIKAAVAAVEAADPGAAASANPPAMMA